MPILLLQGATETARIRASPGNPKYIGPLHSPDLLHRFLTGPCAACPVAPALVLLGAFQGMLWFKDNTRMKRVSHFCLTRHLLPSSPPIPSHPQLHTLPHKVPMCLASPLVYVGPLGSVREEPIVVISALNGLGLRPDGLQGDQPH